MAKKVTSYYVEVWNPKEDRWMYHDFFEYLVGVAYGDPPEEAAAKLPDVLHRFNQRYGPRGEYYPKARMLRQVCTTEIMVAVEVEEVEAA